MRLDNKTTEPSLLAVGQFVVYRYSSIGSKFEVPEDGHFFGQITAINTAITAQGDIVRKLKTDKADKAAIDGAVKKLLALKADYKAATGQDWKPGAAPAPAKAASPAGSSAADINTAIAAQGDAVRKLKADKAAKADIDEAVKKLLALKADFKAATGSDWKPGMTVPAAAPAPAASDSGKCSH